MRYAQGGGLTVERQQFREELRLKAAERFARGDASSVIARDFGVSVRSVQRWRRMWDADGPRALRSQGPASLPRLSGKQFVQTGGGAGQGVGRACLHGRLFTEEYPLLRPRRSELMLWEPRARLTQFRRVPEAAALLTRISMLTSAVERL